eukprot:gene13333-15357_t
MSNPEADVRHETASDVIGNSRPSPEEGGGQPVADVSPVSSIAHDQNDKNMPTIPKIDRTAKMTTHRPTRTSSAPPEEHGADAHKAAHFQPTKTQQSLLSSNDPNRRPYQYNQSAGRPTSYNPGNNGSVPHAPAGPRSEGPASGEAAPASHDNAAAPSDGSAPQTGPSEPSAGPPASAMHIQTGPVIRTHSPLAPVSPAMRSASGDHGSFHTNSSGPNSPAYPNNPGNRNFRNSPNFGSHSSDRSPYNQGQNGPPGNYNNNNNMNREPYNSNRGDYREGGGRAGGRTTRRAPQGGGYGGRGPHMNMHEHGGGPMNMGPGPPVMNQQRGNFVPQPPPHGQHPPMHPPSPQQQQPHQQQWVQVDPYTGAAQMISPPSPQTGPGPAPGSPFQPPNAAYPAGAPVPPGGRGPQPQAGGMQGMNNRGPPPHPNLPPQQQQPHQAQQQLHHQAPMFVPQHGNQPVHPNQQHQQQQMMQQQNMLAQVHQQHMFMHNQAQQQQYMPQQMYVPYEMTPEQMFEMQNHHNMQFQGMQNMQATMQVRGPNGQIMQVMHPASAFPMGMVPSQQMQAFPQQIPAQHMQAQGHVGHVNPGAHPHGQVHGHPHAHGAPQQVYVPQEMYAQQTQMVPMPMHMTSQQQPQGGAAVPAHMQQGMQPGMMHVPVQVPPGGSYSNYPPAVTGVHMPNAQHYNPNLGPQYGPQGGNHMPHQHNTRPPHPSGPHDSQGPPHAPGYGPGQGQGPHQGGPGPRGAYQKSPLPPRDHHNNNASGPSGPHHAHPASPSAVRYNQQHAAPHAPSANVSGPNSAAGAPSGASAVAAGSAAAATGVAAGPETTAATAAPGASEQEAQTAAGSATSASTEGSSTAPAATEGGGIESTPVKVNHTVVYPYQEHDPSQDTTPLPAREKKVLTYKKKDGSALDLNSFQKKEDATTTSTTSTGAAVVETKEVPAETATASAGIAASERDASSETVSAAAVEPVAVAANVANATDDVSSLQVSASTTASAMTSASVSVQPSPRISPKTVPSPSTVPVVSIAEAEVAAPSAVAASATPSATPSAPMVSKRPSTTITVPTVEEQLKDLRIEGPSPVEEEDIGVMGALSPAIKSADLPVFIEISTPAPSAVATVPEVVAASSTSEPSLRRTPSPRDAASDAATATATATSGADASSSAGLQSRNKKSSKKELFAKADASAASSELSAYESTPAVASDAPVKTPIVPGIKVATPRSSGKVTAVQAEASVPDSWDDAEISVSPLVAEPVSAGIKESRSLRPGGNKSFNINLHQTVAVVRFTKAEILAMKPTEKGTNPLAMYGNIALGDSTGAPSGQKGNNWNKGARSDGRNSNDGAEGWKRDNLPPTPSSGTKHKKQHSNVPMPKKIISNQMELLTTETMAILNKITPQTFEKLSQNMLALNVQNIEQMSKVIELIFEKAVQEQGFANLYAELCAFLNAKATHWEFYEVFKVVSSPEDLHGEFFWVRECTFPAVYAGPFTRPTECVVVLQNVAELPAMAPVTAAMEVFDLWLLTQPDLLVKVYRNEKAQFYVTYMPFEDYGAEMRSQHTFVDYKAAQKDAKKLHYFRAKLVTNCQTEFQQSTMNESVYSELEEEKRALLAAKSTLSEAEFFYKSADIDDRRLKLKRRMLGNIRFVGELFKQKLLTDVTILDCISDLMGTPQEWKSMQDEQDIECLCHLLRTAGERLEAKFSTSEDAMRNFNRHFDRLRELSRDKSLNSRMRFALEEVLALRENNWQKRGSAEGPVKIADIHRAPHPHGSPMVGGRGPGGPKGGPQVHHGQQQQQQQHPRMTILPRPGGRGQQQDVRRGEEKFGRTVSVAGHEGNTHGREYANANRPHPGDALRRVQSEYSPPVSGTATPTSTHSAGSHSGSHAGASSSAGTGAGHVRNSSVGSIAAEIDYTDPKMLNRAKSAISEYIEQKDHEEVILFLSEGPAGMYGYFVLQLLDRYLNESKDAVRRAVLGLLQEASLGEVLSGPGAQVEIVQALRCCETLKCLTDTTMDIKEAPERFATVMGTLLRHSVLTDADVTNIMEEAKVNCIEELANLEEEWATVYARFTRQLALSRAA